ncbi:CRISPR-associated helicase Cas3' [Paenibacillus sp. GCM10012307]|uniref:CRISPR-associated helicase Cas3 n=1 Tax=Paenibacillus roseus TaxID=2798579 RepID=A0A934IZI9_9BACL|nr:CRISPR-associated helicase Cas3' [Paenibacillus roseus]MBJ6359940.1 CRISPR-associated helicase Cas3' [Paenibacillus roseus]
MDYIAHIRQKDGKIQTVQDHLREVQELSERLGSKIGVRYLAGLAGVLHDLGKFTMGFRTYIQQAVENPDEPPRKGSVDHSTAGGRLLYRRYHKNSAAVDDKLAAEWISNCVVSHHQGLRDFLDPESTPSFIERVDDKALDEYENAASEFFTHFPEHDMDEYYTKAKAELRHHLSFVQQQGLPPVAISLLIKYIFSCLIDADRTNTRRFEEDEQEEEPFDHLSFFSKSYDKLIHHLQELNQSDHADTTINRLRRAMSLQCEDFAAHPSGIYTLSIPTGGGKTLASLRYALKHAITHGKERIIYIVPYTTIIEQNADEVRNILQEHDMILEHHSNVIEEKGSEDEDYDVKKKKIKLAKDNWDRPIIFTTMVQFLNTFFAKGTRNVRRLHQMSNAVIIFDEVQSVPVKCISLFNAALNFLHLIGRSSLLLCTATQPGLDYVKHKLHLPKEPEIIQNLDEVVKNFKRVEMIDRTTAAGWKAPELAAFIQEQMDEVDSVLAILNTKSAVRKLFAELEEQEWVKESGVRLFHLSTNMCAAHRKEELVEIKKALEDEDRVICVSTQLIEAGVNISFDCVIRSLAGLDSIAQAAGRCNRHGKDPSRNVFIIKSADEVLKQLPEIRIGGEKTERLLHEFRQEPERFGHDLLSPAAMSSYFCYYYHQIGDGDEMHYHVPKLEKNLFDLLDMNKDYYHAYKNKHREAPKLLSRPSFATAEQYFEAISNAATSVLVPFNKEARELIVSLNGELGAGELGTLLQKAQQYMVNIYDHERKGLEKSSNVYYLLHGHVLALRDIAYSEKFGVEITGEGEWSFLST